MPRYHFHVKRGAEVLQDAEGADHLGLEQAIATGVPHARVLFDGMNTGSDVSPSAFVIIESERGDRVLLPLL